MASTLLDLRLDLPISVFTCKPKIVHFDETSLLANTQSGLAVVWVKQQIRYTQIIPFSHLFPISTMAAITSGTLLTILTLSTVTGNNIVRHNSLIFNNNNNRNNIEHCNINFFHFQRQAVVDKLIQGTKSFTPT